MEKEKEKEIWIIGNGLNKALSSSEFLSDEIKNELRKIGSLWERFTPLLREFRDYFQNKLGRSISDEEALEAVAESLSVLAVKADSLGVESACKNCFSSYIKELNSEVFRKIIEVSMQFLELENEGFYTDLARSDLIKEFVSYWESRLEEKEIAIFTMNYDGVVDTIFGRRARVGFAMRDFFRSCSKVTIEKLKSSCGAFNDYVNSLGEYDWRGIGYCFSMDGLMDALDFKNVILHLHGSYKYWHNVNIGVDIKLDRNAIEAFYKCFSREELEWVPMVIFGPPGAKEHLIQKHKVLSTQWAYFTQLLIRETRTNPVKFVIWGTRLNSDPHILELLARGVTTDSVKELVILLKDKESAQEFYEEIVRRLENKGIKQEIPYRYVEYTINSKLVDVVKEI